MKELVPVELITNKIYSIRGQKVMLDMDLALLYGVDTKQLKRQVNRNTERFPEDFMFRLTKGELSNLRCQNGTSSWGGIRYLPYAFTEQGTAMLSSVLNSKRAIQINILIMRAFVKLRSMFSTFDELKIIITQLEKRQDKSEDNIQMIIEAINRLLERPEPFEVKNIGFISQ